MQANPIEIKYSRGFFNVAGQGHAKGQFELGVCYLNGKDVPLDKAAGIKLLRLAAGQGYAKGMFALGLCYLNGNSP